MKKFILFVFISVLVIVGYYYLEQRAIKREPIAPINIPKIHLPSLTVRGIGVLGDSQSDEYRADDNRGDRYANVTLNWVEFLARYRQLNFGRWITTVSPRRTGYEYNWAQTGATTSSALMSGQATGLAEQVKKGEVNIVIIFIGANDFAPFQPEGYDDIYSGKMTNVEVIRKINSVVVNIETAITTIQQGGNVHILVIKIPEWEKRLVVQSYFNDRQKRQRVTNAINKTNSMIDDVAKKHHAETLDPNIFYNNVIGNNDDFVTTIGGVNFDKLTPSNNPYSLYLADNIHPGTVMNGLFANYVIEVMNEKFGTTIRPFSLHEIFNAAGIK